MHGCSNTLYKGRTVPLDLPINTLLGKVQIKTATTIIFSIKCSLHISLYDNKIEGKGRDEGGLKIIQRAVAIQSSCISREDLSGRVFCFCAL